MLSMVCSIAKDSILGKDDILHDSIGVWIFEHLSRQSSVPVRRHAGLPVISQLAKK